MDDIRNGRDARSTEWQRGEQERREQRFLEEVAQRQAAPVVNDRPCIQDMVIADIQARKAVGLQRYGTLLQPFNGRDALMDAYQEALDLCQYLRQVLEERDAPARRTITDFSD